MESVNQQDVARRAGVSRATVSLALSNHPRIPLATRRRIQRLAAELGYRPNPAVTALMASVRARRRVQRIGTLAWVTGHPTRDGWRGAFGIEYFRGATERAEQLGYRLDEIWAKEPRMTGARLTNILLTRGIRGLLIVPLLEPKGRLPIDWSQFAAATMGYSLQEPDLHRAVPDLFADMVTALRQLAQRGYQRIGLATEGRIDLRTNHLQLAAMLAYQYRIRAADRVRPLVGETTEQNLRTWLRTQEPDAVVISGIRHEALVPFLRRLASAPRHIGVVVVQRTLPVAAACLEQNGHAIGAAAVDLVIGQLSSNELGLPAIPKVVQIAGRWVDGPTVRPPRATGG